LATQLPEGVPHVLPVQLAVAEPLKPPAVLAVEALVEPPLIWLKDAEHPPPHVSVPAAQARFAVQVPELLPPLIPLHIQV
jgi:hypothetical protein